MPSFTTLEMLLNRRRFLTHAGMGLGVSALANVLAGQGLAATPDNEATSGAPGTHFPAKAKRVIFLFMAGAPSQLDLFDYKPDLAKLFKTDLPESISKGQRVTSMTKGKGRLVAPSKFKFSKKGESGIWMSELLPHLSKHTDDLCFINSMNTNAINHDPGKTAF